MTRPPRGAIAAGHAATAEAGAEMFRRGGNAFDAAVAAVLTACVAEPCMTSLAGGGFLLAHTAANKTILYDFFSQTPRSKRPLSEVDFSPVEVHFGDGGAVQEFHIGMGSIAVPGTVGGLYHVHQRLGQLPLHVVAEPAIQYAKAGVPLDSFQAYCFKILSPIWRRATEATEAIAPGGVLLKAGDLLKLPNLDETLTRFATEGAAAFYTGAIAQQLIRDCRDHGGFLTADDLANYRVIERQPLTVGYRSTTFLTNPPPSSGGALIAFALSLLSTVDVSALSFGSAEHLSLLAQVMRLTNLARKDGYDQRLYEPDVTERFLADPHVGAYATQMVTPILNKWGSTTHISTVDAEGNAASVTTSNGEGCSYVIPGTGVMVNNMLGEADLHPGGFHQWQLNQRISSMMAPTIVLKDGAPEIVLGSGGSNRIRTAILQVISNIVDFQMEGDAAVNSPRVHWENGVFNLEPGLNHPNEISTPFTEHQRQWEEQNMFFGGVHTVLVDATGRLTPIGDRRRSGAIALG